MMPESFETIVGFMSSRASRHSIESLRNAHGRPSRLKVEAAADGRKSFSFESPACRTLLHSRRAPEAEAERQVADWRLRMKGQGGGVILILGLAAMHHIKAMLSGLRPGTSVMVADPAPDIFLAAASECGLDSLAKDGVELLFSVSENPKDIVEDVKALLERRGCLAPSIFMHPSCRRALPDEYASLEGEIRKSVRMRFMDGATLGAIGGEWTDNAIGNIPLCLETPMADCLESLFSGRTAIVAGAGPSLDMAIPYIKEALPNAPLIAVGTALKPLAAASIKPDFAIAIDSDPRVASQFEGLPDGFCNLLSSHHMTPSLLRKWQGRLFLFSTPLVAGVNRLIENFGALPVSLKTAGTVALTAVEAARLLGCRDIILAGVDLAMSPDRLSHASNSVYHGLRIEQGRLCPVPGNLGREVFTTRQFALYAEIFNSYFPELASKGVRIWNCSPFGAAFDSAAFRPPEHIPELCGGTACDTQRASMPSLWADSARASRELAVKSLNAALHELDSLSKAASDATEACRIIFRSPESPSHSGILLAELDRLDKRIKADNLAFALVNEVLQPMLMRMAAEAPGDSPNAVAEWSLDFYGSVVSASAWASKRLKEICSEIEAGA